MVVKQPSELASSLGFWHSVKKRHETFDREGRLDNNAPRWVVSSVGRAVDS